MLSRDPSIPRLSETRMRYSLEVCGLCGQPINKESCYFMEIIGFVCSSCFHKKRSYVVYKCIFCQSSGFGKEKNPLDPQEDIVLLLSCPFCEEPLNRLPA